MVICFYDDRGAKVNAFLKIKKMNLLKLICQELIITKKNYLLFSESSIPKTLQRTANSLKLVELSSYNNELFF